MSAPIPEIDAVVHEVARQHHTVHFRSTVDQPCLTGVAVDPLERSVTRIAAGAAQLDRRIDCLVQSIGNGHLCHRHLLAGEVAGVQLPGGVHGKQAADLDIHGSAAQHPLYAFTLCELEAERLAFHYTGSRDLEGTLGQPQPAHAVGQACGAQANLGELEAVAHVHQAVFIGNVQAIELDLAMAAVFFGAHDRYAAHDLPVRIVFVKEEGRQAFARIIGRFGDEDEVRGGGGTGDEVLAAMHD